MGKETLKGKKDLFFKLNYMETLCGVSFIPVTRERAFADTWGTGALCPAVSLGMSGPDLDPHPISVCINRAGNAPATCMQQMSANNNNVLRL